MKQSPLLLPRVQRLLKVLGENIKLARLRRHISAELLAERANISRSTLGKIEQGVPTVSMGAYVSVLFVLGIENDLAQLGAHDELGRKMQDLQLLTPKRAPKNRTKPAADDKP